MKYSQIKVGDVCELINGCAYKSKEFTENGIPVIKIANVKPGRIVKDKMQCVPEQIANEHKKQLIQRGDILLTMTGNRINGTPDSWVGKAAVFKENGEFTLNQRVCAIRANSSVIEPNFLGYVLSSWKSQLYFIKRSTSSGGQANISPNTVKNYSIPYPTMDTQKRIVRILSAFDQKIELNNRQNSLITELLKLNYEKTTRDSNTKTKVALQDIFNFQEGPGIRNWQYVEKDGTRFINIRCIKDDDLDLSTANMISVEEANGKYAHFMLKEGDIVVSTSGTLGRSQIIRKAHLPLCLNTSVIRFWPKEPYYYSFMYCYIISSEFLHNLDVMATGSAQRNFGPMHLRQIDIDIMDNDTIKLFEKENRPLIKKLCLNRDENISLKNIRDNLLPKLMSGEIDLKKVMP